MNDTKVYGNRMMLNGEMVGIWISFSDRDREYFITLTPDERVAQYPAKVINHPDYDGKIREQIDRDADKYGEKDFDDLVLAIQHKTLIMREDLIL